MYDILQNISKLLISAAISGSLILVSCGLPLKHETQWTEVEKIVHQGKFRQATQVIDSLKQDSHMNPREYGKLDSLQDMMYRISLDFSRNDVYIKKQLSRYFDHLDDEMIRQWEHSKKLEMRLIDGEKWYFRNAVPNLFRLDSLAAMQKMKRDGMPADSLGLFRLGHTAKVIHESRSSFNPVLPVPMVLTYTIRVKPNAVPAGEMIRCWMPVPRESNPRQQKFKLLSTIPDSVILAPDHYLQRTAFLQKQAISNEPTVFTIRFSLETAAQYFDLEPDDIKPYDTTGRHYHEFTDERPPQLVFTPAVRQLAKKIVGRETNPLRKVEKIYRWINDSISWASALEYGTLSHIPGYVLQNRHGDCGMQTLLFMSLVRSQGIPAKWQSGWMLHPGHVNLHDWCEVYYEGVGWVPVDQSFGLQNSQDQQIHEFYIHGIDSYRLIVNDDFGRELFPAKKYIRSEPYDFQRGELEWNGGNLYFDQWSWEMEVEYDTKVTGQENKERNANTESQRKESGG